MTRPLTSIVILTRNQLGLTQACLESIARCTPEPHELVLVDNGSSDGTVEFLRAVPEATVVENGRNLGFGGGCNQGIALARGERILLLNNDVVVTPGWLGALHDALDADPTRGIVGPRTNQVSGEQRVAEVGYDLDTLGGLEEFAATWCDARRGEVTPVPRLVGFCMLAERIVFERIGGFDLRYGVGNFEDDDLCLRAGVAGFRCGIAEDSFIHHHGSRTFAGEQIDYAATMDVNFARFAAAWQMAPAEVGTGSYSAGRVLDRTSWDERRHYAPVVGVADRHGRVAVDAGARAVLAVPCDRFDPEATAAMLTAALDAFGPEDAVTVAVRIDPRDARSQQLLEQAADRVGDARLPDVVVLEAPDEDDLPLLRRADAVLVYGPRAWTRDGLARHASCRPVGLDDLADLRDALGHQQIGKAA